MPEFIIYPEWKKPPFYQEDAVSIQPGTAGWEKEMSHYPYLAEIAVQNGYADFALWEDPFPAIEHWQLHWQHIKTEIKIHIAAGEGERAFPLMIPAISGLIESMFWLNGRPASLHAGSWNELNILPVNGKERIEFICSRPVHHHSFAQLNELYEEVRRKAAVLKQRRT